jgi:DDE superfamily endonuclease
MGTHTSLTPCKVPRNRGKNTALLASMSAVGMGTPLAVAGAVEAQVFEAYLEWALLPELPPRRILVMDNLSAHKTEKARELIEAQGCELLSTCRPTRRTSTP